MLKKQQQRQKRKQSIRKRITGTSAIPRLSIFRSSKHLEAQLIDDVSGKTLVGMSSRVIADKIKKEEKATKLGELFAKKMSEAEIDRLVFDRAGYRYHGRVKAFAESLRNSGIKF